MKLQGSMPHLVTLMGIPGAGKTYFAEQFAKSFNAPLISFDKISIELFGQKATTPKQRLVTEKLTYYLLREVLKTRHTIIYDGPTEQRSSRTKVRKIAQEFEYEPILIWVQTKSEVAMKRYNHSLKGSGPQFDTLLKKFDSPIVSEKTVVISGHHTFSTQLKIVLRYLASQKAEPVTIDRKTPIGRR